VARPSGRAFVIRRGFIYCGHHRPALNEARFVSSPLPATTSVIDIASLVPLFCSGLLICKMDTHIADEKLKELHVEDTTVKANRDALQYEIDSVAEKKLLRKIDLHVVPILWFLFMYVITHLASLVCEARSMLSLLTSNLPGSRSWIGPTSVRFPDACGDD
jgi:hypothetical protein